MPSEAAKAPSGSTASSFAKLFAGLTAPKNQDTDARADSWMDDALAEDVATISYEQALRAHARYRRPDPPPPSVEETAPTAPKPPQSVPITEWVADNASPAFVLNRKLASITIRLSRRECQQLKERAAAAGLTVSAYLRSCIFEVEALRAQVKEALAQLRSETCAPETGTAQTQHVAQDTNSPTDWRTRLFAHWSRNRNQPDA